MTTEELTAALDLPAAAIVNQRIPKTLLLEHGAPTAADKRRINEGIEELRWLATLKPTTVGVPAYRDEVREYLEVAVLGVALRTGAKADRLTELIHRAVPYPVFLSASAAGEDVLSVSLAHKRWSQAEADATVLDGELVAVEVGPAPGSIIERSFLSALPLGSLPRADLFALYQGWIDVLVALRTARVTGVFAVAETPERAAERRAALAECERLDAQVRTLRAAAAKERQIARQVELNLELQQVLATQKAARARL